MGVIKTLLMIIYIIISIVLIVFTLIQTKDSSDGAQVITGSSSNFYNQNKGKTREGKLKRTTIALGICFAVLAVVLSIFYI